MKRALSVVLLLVVAAGIWIELEVIRPAREREARRDRLADDAGRAEAAKRHDQPATHEVALRKIPRTESHVWLELRWPKGAPRALFGGEILASFRGNGVVFHRAGLGDATWRRGILDEEARAGVYRRLRAATAPAAQSPTFPVTLRLSTEESEAFALAENEASAVLAAILPRAKRWWPATVTLSLAPEADAKIATGWPKWPAPPFPAPDSFVAAPAPFGAPNPTRDRLLGDLLDRGGATASDGRAFRLAAFTVTLP